MTRDAAASAGPLDYDLRAAILRGQIAARHTCAQRASSSALITREELDRHFATLS